MSKISKELLALIYDLDAENLLLSSGSSIIIIYILTLYDAELEGRDLNKTKLMNSVPDQLGGSSRRRYLLDRLMHSGAATSHQGKKKSEQNIKLTPRVKSILDRRYG